MRIAKTLGVVAMSAAIIAGGLQVGTSPQEAMNHADTNQPKAEMVIEDAFSSGSQDSVYYTPVHLKGQDAIQQETDMSGLFTLAPSQLPSNLDQANVEGRYDQDLDVSDYSAHFSSSQTGASFEVVCTNDGIGDALIDGKGPITLLENGIVLQQTGPNEYSSQWVQTSPDASSHCAVKAHGLSKEQVVEMASTLSAYAPSHVNGAYIAH